MTRPRGSTVSEILERFGKKLRSVRTGKGISQEELARQSGLHRTYVSSVERGERNISLANIAKLAGGMGVRMGDLMPRRRCLRESGLGFQERPRVPAKRNRRSSGHAGSGPIVASGRFPDHRA